MLKNRITVMEETLFFLNSLMSEIEFSKMNIPEILSSLSEREAVRNLTFLGRFSDFGLYGDFRKEWCEGISSFSCYKSEEKEKMLQLGAFLGTTDTESQIKTLKLYFNYFENYRENAVSEFNKYGKVSSLFGMFLGASVFVLLL